MTPTTRTPPALNSMVSLAIAAVLPYAAGCTDDPPAESEASQALYSPPNMGGPLQITNKSTGQCLEVLGNSIFPQAPVSTTPCNGGLNQRWLVRFHPACLDTPSQKLSCGHVVFINVNSGLCLDVPGGIVPHTMQQYTCNYGTNQRFLLDTASDGTVIWSFSQPPNGATPPAAILWSPGPSTTIQVIYTEPADPNRALWLGLPF